MKLKQLKYFLFILLCSASCKKDFLEIEDRTFFYRQVYVKDLSTMEDFLNGIYHTYAMSIEVGTLSGYPDVISDNMKPANIASGPLLFHYTWNQQADESSSLYPGNGSSTRALNGAWMVGYRIIRDCSFIIEDIKKYRSENVEHADDLLGQAYGLRALMHFKLVNIYAQQYNFTANASHPGVPYITDSDISKSYSRQTVDVVYQNIISDYLKALELLRANSDDTRYLNRIAVKALLARTYLFKEDFAKAQSLAKEVADQKPLQSVAQGYPGKLFEFVKDPQYTEVLFQCSPSNSQTANYVGTLFLGYEVGTRNRFHATNDIAALLKELPDDTRQSWINGSEGAYRIKKFPSNVAPEVPGMTSERAYYQCIVRSSEAYLIVAEAAAKSGNEVMARTYLNMLRRRVSANSEEITESGQALFELIQKERRKELCFEGFRMFDLLRWKMPVHRVDAPNATAKDLPYPSDKAIAPIPPADTKLIGIPQNLGY